MRQGHGLTPLSIEQVIAIILVSNACSINYSHNSYSHIVITKVFEVTRGLIRKAEQITHYAIKIFTNLNIMTQ